jgi:hypothetical protein
VSRPASYGGTASSYKVQGGVGARVDEVGGIRTAVGVEPMSAVAAADMWSGIVQRGLEEMRLVAFRRRRWTYKSSSPWK